MKKLLYILMLVFVLPFNGLTQNNTIVNKEKTSDSSLNKNQIDLDLELIGLNLSYKKRISDKLFLGLSGNVGIPRGLFTYEKNKGFLRPNYKKSTQAETKGMVIYIDYYLNYKLHILLGTKYGFFDDTNGAKGNFYGLEMGVYYNYKKVEFGLKPIFGVYDEDTNLIGLPIFLIRFNLSKW